MSKVTTLLHITTLLPLMLNLEKDTCQQCVISSFSSLDRKPEPVRYHKCVHSMQTLQRLCDSDGDFDAYLTEKLAI